MLPTTTATRRQATEGGRQRASNARTFPINPDAPGGPDRAQYLARHYLARTPVREHPRTLAQAGPA
jgi:hypothetical protein